MLYATDGIRSDDDFNKAMVGVGSVWCVFFPSLTVALVNSIVPQVRRQPVRFSLFFVLSATEFFLKL